MATFRTRDRMEALRFVRSLVERGYTKRDRPAKGGALPMNTYQVSRDAPQYVVSYYEPDTDRKLKPIPEAMSVREARGLSACTVAGCNRPHHSRGLCSAHHQRWLRSVNPETKERMRVRAYLNRLKAREERKEEAA